MLAGNNHQPLKIKLDTKVEPDNQENKEDATNNLYGYLSNSSVQEQLSKDLSKKLNTELEVCKIDTGSVVIELGIKNFEQIENIKSLSDTGVLSNIFGSLFLTPKYLSSCLAEKIYIRAKVDDRSYHDLMTYAKGY